MKNKISFVFFVLTVMIFTSCGSRPKLDVNINADTNVPASETSRDPASDPKEEVGGGPIPQPSPITHPQVSAPIFGVTIDGVTPLDEILKALMSLPVKPTVRIVFDEFVKAKDYKNAATRIHAVSYIMGELLDSLYVPQYSLAEYKNRVLEYMKELNGLVDIWEIGNEVNGEWLGKTFDVVAKILAAYELVKQNGGKTALTLYYNQNCWEKPENEMFQWAAKNLPLKIKEGLDYVLISYYEEDCNNLKPNWVSVFNKLGALFPNSKIGFGEIGTSNTSAKADYMKRYYSMNIGHPRYIGGYFWWYFRQDMVPMNKGLWSIFSTLLQALKSGTST